jgi:hypothetical protein
MDCVPEKNCAALKEELHLFPASAAHLARSAPSLRSSRRSVDLLWPGHVRCLRYAWRPVMRIRSTSKMVRQRRRAQTYRRHGRVRGDQHDGRALRHGR